NNLYVVVEGGSTMCENFIKAGAVLEAEPGLTGDEKFVLVNDDPEGNDWTGTYLIGYNYQPGWSGPIAKGFYFLDGSSTSWQGDYPYGVAINKTDLYMSSIPSAVEDVEKYLPYSVKIEKSGEGYAIKLASGKYISADSTNGALVDAKPAKPLTLTYLASGVKIEGNGNAFGFVESSKAAFSFGYPSSTSAPVLFKLK
ncbi:MAG: hypothetical protein HUJ94_08460, partial [Bacteroidales bacterium]|nr:hypothetical protein [Bacteroidales bacterium]